MPTIPPIFGSTFSDVAALIYKIYPHRIQKGNRFQYNAENNLLKDFAAAKRKMLITCHTFTCHWHPDIDPRWFNNAVNSHKDDGVTIVIASEVDPPEFIQKFVDSGAIHFRKTDHLPFVSHLVDDKIIDISVDARDGGLSPGGFYWRTEYAMPDILEFLKDLLISTTSHDLKQLI